jgi:hypothetical protein
MKRVQIVSLLILLLVQLAWSGQVPSNSFPGRWAVRSASSGAAGLQAHRARVRAQAEALERFRRELVARGVLTPRTTLPRLDTFLIADPAALRLPPRTRAADGPTTLSLAYQGWTVAEEEALTAFLTPAYPILVSLYGPPATTATLTVVKAGVGDAVEGGEFDPGTMTLTVEALPTDFATTDASHYGLNLLHLLLHAFHAPVLLSFDAWEEGMARAAALVAMTQLRASFDPMRDPLYLLPTYELLNQPELATAAFFPRAGIPQMLLWRLGMATAAWLKLYTQQPNLWVAFNSAYYQRATTTPGIAADLAGLKALLAGIVPQVEGQAFYDWYPRQFVLQPTSAAGPRLYLLNTPLHDNAILYAHYFTAQADGTETPLAGTVQLKYWSFDAVPLYAEEGEQILITAVGDTPGVGSINPSFYNIGQEPVQRIRIECTLGALSKSLLFPYFVRGDDANEREFFGAVLGADSGSLRIEVPGLPVTATVTQGAYGQDLPTGDVKFFSPVQFTLTVDGIPHTFWRNIGPGIYVALFTVEANRQVTWSQQLPAGLSLVSFPLTPQATDPAPLFGFPEGSTDLQMSWWDPALPGSDRYRRYPDAALQQPVPGKAYWVRLPTARDVVVTGTRPPDDDPRSVVLQPGWNLVGNTFNAALDPWAMRVEVGTMTLPLPEAIAQGAVGPLWTLNRDTTSYETPVRVPAWSGGWMLNTSSQAITLIQYGAASTRGRGTAGTLAQWLTSGGWGMELQARTARAQDRGVTLGVRAGATLGVDGMDWLKPPAVERGGVRLALVHPGRRSLGATYATDLRAPLAGAEAQWEFEVKAEQSEEVVVSWPDLRAVPTQYTLVLEDLATGVQQYLRTTASYRYRATGTLAAPDVRRFRITIRERQGTSLQIAALQVLSTRGGSGVRVVVNAPAELTLDIRTPTGKLLRTIRIPASRAGESVVIPWDGRGISGKLVPTGTYLINLTARSAEGFVIRRSQTILHRE